jgi:hypothetical protein
LKTKILAVLALTLTTAIALPAMARENPRDFPMPAATFEQHVEARLQRARMRMESDIAARNLTDVQANEVRAHFNAVVANVEGEVQKAVADGTVTLEEATAVRAVARQLHMHRGRRPQVDA